VDIVYTPLFEPRRHTLKKLLEIGIWHGASLRAWHDYFPSATIVGIDRGTSPLFQNESRVVTCCGNAYSAEMLAALPNDFDIIIEDGSHELKDLLFVAKHYVSKLAPGGLLILEDIAEAAWATTLRESLDPQYTAEVYDLREQKGRYDDILMIIRQHGVA